MTIITNVIATSNNCLADYFCKIQCTHKTCLKLVDNEYLLDQLDGTRNLKEVHHISQLQMVSKILSLEVTADINMEYQRESYDTNDCDSTTMHTRSSVILELETKDRQKIKEETVLCTEEEDGAGRYEWVYICPKERLEFRVEKDIQRASLEVWVFSEYVGSTTLQNIQTITTVAVK